MQQPSSWMAAFSFSHVMNARWYLGLGLGAALLFFLGWCRPTALTRSWETQLSPTDKPAINFVIATRANGEPFLRKVILSGEDPHSGKVVKREVDFKVIAPGRDKIAFELKEVPGEVHELALPQQLSGSFKVELKSVSTGTTEVLQFDEMRR